MDKEIFSIGYNIPGHSDNYYSFSSKASLMDADIVVFCPDFSGYDSDDDYQGKTCYSQNGSFQLIEDMKHWQKEIEGFLKSGKNVFLLMIKKDEYYLHTGNKSFSGTGRSRVTTNVVDIHNNYESLPIDIGNIRSVQGKHILPVGNNLFVNLYKNFYKNLGYQVYLENIGNNTPVFTGKDKAKVLGAIYKAGAGNLIALPHLYYKEDEFTDIRKNDEGEDEEYWSKKAIIFGKEFIKCLIEIDKAINYECSKTPPPEWVAKTELSSAKEKDIYKAIEINNGEIDKIEKENEKLRIDLQEEQVLKDLLYEQGKPLEKAVIKALTILGYNPVFLR